jgi:hypothetical protein
VDDAAIREAMQRMVAELFEVATQAPYGRSDSGVFRSRLGKDVHLFRLRSSEALKRHAVSKTKAEESLRHKRRESTRSILRFAAFVSLVATVASVLPFVADVWTSSPEQLGRYLSYAAVLTLAMTALISGAALAVRYATSHGKTDVPTERVKLTLIEAYRDALDESPLNPERKRTRSHG